MSQLDEFDAALRAQFPLLCGVDGPDAGRWPVLFAVRRSFLIPKTLSKD